MLHFASWKIWAITASVVLALLLSLPNVLPTAQQEALKPYGIRPMTLGLDLQGGSNVLLEVEKEKLADQLIRQLASDVRSSLREQRVAFTSPVRSKDSVAVTISKPEDLEKAQTALANLVQPQQGNILLGAGQVNLFELTANSNTLTLKFTDAGFVAKVTSSLQQTMRIMEKRINAFGTAETSIQQQGPDRIAIQLPGVTNPDAIKETLIVGGKLMFHLVCDEQPAAQAQTPPPDCRSYPYKEQYEAALEKKREADKKAKLTEAEIKQLPQMWVQTATLATVDGADLTGASPSFDQDNRPVVSFQLNQRGAIRFGNLTKNNVNKPFAIVLDEVVQSAPVINEPILGGQAQISGNYTTEETGKMAVILQSGALPADFKIAEERTVGPSLGADSVRAGFVACLIGLIGVMLFMFLPYGFFGFVANLALLANLLLLIASMSFFGFTLTLPGIAGILLTLGMAVDSNVLIYERIREEWRNGRTALSSIETGFKSALGTVLDANITTLIAAVVLFGVGSGPVRGFAVTLAIGIFTTMFTAFTVTRMIVAIWVKRSRPKEINL